MLLGNVPSGNDQDPSGASVRYGRLAWLPIPFFLILMVVAWGADSTVSRGSPSLLFALNFVFTTLESLVVAFLIGRSFLTRGEPALLLLGCGVLVWGAAGLVSVGAGGRDINVIVTIHNLGLCLAGLCYLSGAVLAIRPRAPLRSPSIWLVAGYTGGLATLAFFGLIGSEDWTPTFFVQGEGGTPLRQLVVGAAVGMFLLAAILLRAVYRRSITRFMHWYTLGLLLNATGLAGLMALSSFGSMLSWVSRASQYLGGVYLLVAAVVSVRDSKEWRVTLEESLTEARRRYDDLFNLAADAIVVHELVLADAYGEVRRANQAACDLLGYDSAQIHQLSILEFLSPEDRAAVVREAGGMVREGVIRFEKTLISRDGRRIPTEINARLFRDLGHPLVMAVIRDMTEHKRAEQQVRELSQRLAYHVDNSPLAVIEWGPDMRLSRWSKEAEKLFGWKAEEVLGKRKEDFRWIHEDDYSNVAVVSEELRLGTAGRFSSNRNYRKDGSVVFCEWYNSSLMDESGALRSILSLVLDVTARKQSEQKLEEEKRLLDALLENVPEGILIVDGQMRVLALSRYAQEVIGQTAPGMSVGEVLHDWKMYLPDGVTQIATEDRPLVRALRTGEPVRDQEVLVATSERRLPLLCNAAPIRDRTGAIIGGVVAWRDLTNRKHNEERLRHAQKLESIGLLAGGIAHDFNNLLVGVIGNASLAKDLLPSGHPAAELLDQVVSNGEHAALLTRQMLAYSGQGRFVVESIDLSATVAEIADLVRPAIPKKVTVHLDLQPHLPAMIADGGQIQQVVMNLILNAGEAIGDRVGVVSVRTGVMDIDSEHPVPDLEGANALPGRYVFLEVRDTGCGMDKETRAKIFDPFFTTKFTGRGLGLAAVFGILRGHKGTIQVTSELGQGSCFTALFPASDGTSGPNPRPAAPPAKVQGSGTVLVVDDEDVVRRMATRALEKHGFHVVAAQSGSEATDLLRDGIADISAILLDLSMPEMSGTEALAKIRELNPKVKVVVSSGFSEDVVMPLFAGYKVSGFLQKPYTVSRLAEAIQAAIEAP